MKKDFDTNIASYLILFLAISSCFFYAYSVDKHLSADGVHYFIRTLEVKSFFNFAWSRQFATYLTMWPLIMAAQTDLKDIPLLKLIFAAGLYFPYLVAFGISIYAVRQKLFLLIFPLISIVMISFASDYMLVGEYHVMAIFAWPILFFLLKKEKFNWQEIILLWGLLILFCRLYEIALIPALIYMAIIVVRFHAFRSKPQYLIHGITLLLCSLTLVIAIDSILNPRDPANKNYFLNGIIVMFQTKELWLNLSFVFLLTLGLWLRNKIVLSLSFLPTLVYVAVIVFADHGNMSTMSYAARTLSAILLPFLLCSAIFLHYFDVPRMKLGILAANFFILVMVIGNLRFTTTDWADFRQQFIRTLLSTHSNYIPMSETSFHHNLYRWGWNNPSLSLIWSEPCVKTIILNPTDNEWEPFDPKKELALKNYVQYDPTFKKVDSYITICDKPA